MGAGARIPAVTVPLGFPSHLRRALLKQIERRAPCIGWKAVLMQQSFGVGQFWQKAAGSEAIRAESVTVMSEHVLKRNAVSFI